MRTHRCLHRNWGLLSLPQNAGISSSNVGDPSTKMWRSFTRCFQQRLLSGAQEYGSEDTIFLSVYMKFDYFWTISVVFSMYKNAKYTTANSSPGSLDTAAVETTTEQPPSLRALTSHLPAYHHAGNTNSNTKTIMLVLWLTFKRC